MVIHDHYLILSEYHLGILGTEVHYGENIPERCPW